MSGCTISMDVPEKPVKSVDLEKFMGQWYVIAFTPTFVDEGAWKWSRNLPFTRGWQHRHRLHFQNRRRVRKSQTNRNRSIWSEQRQMEVEIQLAAQFWLSFDRRTWSWIPLHCHRSTKQELCLDHVKEEEDGWRPVERNLHSPRRKRLRPWENWEDEVSVFMKTQIFKAERTDSNSAFLLSRD